MHERQDLVYLVIFILFKNLCFVLVDLVLSITHKGVLFTSAKLLKVAQDTHVRSLRWLLQVRIEEL